MGQVTVHINDRAYVVACGDGEEAHLKDLAARHVGADVTPHLMRSLGGKIVLDVRPGAVALVQQLLGHKRLQTTLGFYTRLDANRTRAANRPPVVQPTIR